MDFNLETFSAIIKIIENSWEPIENVLNCWDLVKEFYRKFSPNVHRPPTDELRRLGKFLPLFIKRDVMSRIP